MCAAKSMPCLPAWRFVDDENITNDNKIMMRRVIAIVVMIITSVAAASLLRESNTFYGRQRQKN